MITKKNLKLFLSFLSLVAFISCSAGNKLGSETQSSQGGLKSNLPIFGKGHKSELVGTWSAYGWGGQKYSIIIDSDGNINFNCRISSFSSHYNYSGKLADDFVYPYTIQLIYIATNHPCDYKHWDDGISKLNPQYQTGTFTFHNESTLTASYYMVHNPTSQSWMGWKAHTNDFKKE